MQTNHPIVVLIRGLPGSGKSYIANRLQNSLGKDITVMLDPDAVDINSQEYKNHVDEQIKEGVDERLHLYRFSRAKAYKGIEEDKIILWNQPFTNLDVFNKMVARLKDHASLHHKKMPILVVELQIDPDIAKERMLKRKQVGGHGPSDETWLRFVNDYKSFAEHGYKTITIQGNNDVDDSVAKIKTTITSLM